LANEEEVFFSMRFLLQRPLLKAILSEQPTVLLIDEIDRADAEFEAFLLEVLSDFQVSVPELGTLSAIYRPLVVLTSNNTRELSEALKRRCLYLFIDYPSIEQEMAVVRLKVPELSPKLAMQAVEMVQSLLNGLAEIEYQRDFGLGKALVALNSNQLDKSTLDTTLSVLLKHENDLQRPKVDRKSAMLGFPSDEGLAHSSNQERLSLSIFNSIGFITTNFIDTFQVFSHGRANSSLHHR
jgi:MoxR-like ATPase